MPTFDRDEPVAGGDRTGEPCMAGTRNSPGALPASAPGRWLRALLLNISPYVSRLLIIRSRSMQDSSLTY